MKAKHRILIVDDDLDDREIMRDAFMEATGDPEYLFMENGDRLMTYLHQQPDDDLPSLILLDLNMPGKDGRESLKELKTNPRLHHIPALVFTTSSSLRDRQSAYELGANCFITKPDTFNKLTDLAKSIAKLWLH
jgi:CheY-like chemotaxis protein